MKELSLHILDITQNSIRAQAKLVKLVIIESVAKNELTIIIEDDGCGIPADRLQNITDPFVTTRTTRSISSCRTSVRRPRHRRCLGRKSKRQIRSRCTLAPRASRRKASSSPRARSSMAPRSQPRPNQVSRLRRRPIRSQRRRPRRPLRHRTPQMRRSRG